MKSASELAEEFMKTATPFCDDQRGAFEAGFNSCIEELSKSEGFEKRFISKMKSTTIPEAKYPENLHKARESWFDLKFVNAEIEVTELIDIRALASANAKIMQLEKEKAELEQALKDAKEVIEFYGNEDNWIPIKGNVDCWHEILGTDVGQIVGIHDKSIGGKRARAYLNKKTRRMKMKQVFGILNAFEGEPLYFDLNAPETPQKLVDYIKNNIDKNETREFVVEDMTDEDFAALD